MLYNVYVRSKEDIHGEESWIAYDLESRLVSSLKTGICQLSSGLLSRTEFLTGPPVPRLGTTGPTIFVRTKKSVIGSTKTGRTPHVAVRR
jgi:hypothetical protein